MLNRKMTRKMKIQNILKVALFSLVILSSTSCSDYLDMKPLNTRVEENFYQNQQDMYDAMVAVYDVLQWGGFQGYIPEETLANVASDDTYAGGANAGDQPAWVALDNFSLTPTLGPQASIWGRYYSGIYRANLFLEKLPGATVSDDFAKRSTAEVKFLRAFYYFQLERWFGNLPLILKTLNPSEYDFPQSAPADIYAQIEKDLTEAIPDLPLSVSDSEKGRITKGAAQSLLGRVILFENDDTRMGEVATLVDNVVNSGAYDLVPDYGQIFTSAGRNNIESVFEIQHSYNSKWGDWGWLPGGEGNIATVMIGMRDYNGPTFQAGWGFSPVTEKLANDMKGDPRFEYSIIDVSDGTMDETGMMNATLNGGEQIKYKPGYQNTGYFVRKNAPLKENVAPDGEPMINYPNNVRVIRYPDVLLMGAEAYARSGNDAKAQGYLNQVRARVGLSPVTATGTDLVQAIWKERRFELAFEGQRYWDLVRTGRASSVLGDRNWQEGRNEYLPIPQSEIDNTNRTLEQNPGY
jgi:hypothetical protein